MMRSAAASGWQRPTVAERVSYGRMGMLWELIGGGSITQFHLSLWWAQ